MKKILISMMLLTGLAMQALAETSDEFLSRNKISPPAMSETQKKHLQELVDAKVEDSKKVKNVKDYLWNVAIDNILTGSALV
ncbi:MAG: hypothetical protein HY077_10560 [Elusimicrobia bacterium]|nr:hypothetical protein [Elusimicrobiota bacterium]